MSSQQSKNSLLARLESFKELTWYETGSALSGIYKAKEWKQRYRSFEDLIKKVAAVVEKSPRQIRRYQTSYEFLQRLHHEGRLKKAEEAAVVPEVTLDCLARLDRVDSMVVDSILKDLPFGVPTYSEARRMLDVASQADMTILEPRAYSRREAQHIAQRWTNVTMTECKQLSRDYGSPQLPMKLPFSVSADFITIGRNDTWCDGFHLLMCEGDKPSISSAIAKIAWSSRFFRKYWIWVIPRLANPRAMEHLLELIKIANPANIGIVERLPNNQWAIKRRPKRPDDASGEARAHLLAKLRDTK